MIAFIQDHRDQHGVEPMCRVLHIAPSTFYEHQAIARDPDRASDRAKRNRHFMRAGLAKTSSIILIEGLNTYRSSTQNG